MVHLHGLSAECGRGHLKDFHFVPAGDWLLENEQDAASLQAMHLVPEGSPPLPASLATSGRVCPVLVGGARLPDAPQSGPPA